MRKLFILLSLFIFSATIAQASIEKTILSSHINSGAVSISVKDLDTGKVVYEHYAQKPSIPASTLKVVTFAAVIDELGADYNFVTSLYKNPNNELFLKLSADPFLQNGDLKNLLRAVKDKKIQPKSIKIDDTVLDNVEWGEGWQWDDALNPLMPKFSSYNLDGNLLTLYVEPTNVGLPAYLELKEFYPVTFMNLVVTDDKRTNIKLTKNDLSAKVLNIEGTVASKKDIVFPTDSPKRYFIVKLDEAFTAVKLNYYGKFTHAKLPASNVYLISSVSHSLKDAYKPVLKDSNNMVAETVFKLAGGHFAKSTGTSESALKMLDKYLKKQSLNSDDIHIVDGSGVSKNNIVTADFMTSFLIAQNKKDSTYKDFLPAPGEGTLRNRMLYFQNNMKAKTGSLADVSAIAGYITTKSGGNYAFYININDGKSKMSAKKDLEEYILREIYTSY